MRTLAIGIVAAAAAWMIGSGIQANAHESAEAAAAAAGAELAATTEEKTEEEEHWTIQTLRAMSSAMSSADKEEDRMTLQRFEDVKVQEFPWGWIRWTMNAELDPSATMTVGVVHLKPHQANPLHRHPNSDEILIVVEGSLEHRLGDGWVRMRRGDTIRIPKGMKHQARTGEEACTVVVVFDTGHRQMEVIDEAPDAP